MKDNDRMSLRKANELIAGYEASGAKMPENPPLGIKYLNTTAFKFGGKKRSASNSGGCGRAARRKKRKG